MATIWKTIGARRLLTMMRVFDDARPGAFLLPTLQLLMVLFMSRYLQRMLYTYAVCHLFYSLHVPLVLFYYSFVQYRCTLIDFYGDCPGQVVRSNANTFCPVQLYRSSRLKRDPPSHRLPLCCCVNILPHGGNKLCFHFHSKN